MKSPIVSRKHIVQWSLFTVGTVSVGSQTIAIGVDALAKNTPSECTEGSVIKAVYLELWFENSSNDGSAVCIVHKGTNAGNNPTYAQTIALDTWTGKKNILFTHQGLTANDAVGNPIPIYRGWLKIPKSKQRFGLGDHLTIMIANTSLNDLNICGFSTYKEYM